MSSLEPQDPEIIDTEAAEQPRPPTEVTEALATTERTLGIAPSSPTAAIAAQLVAMTQAHYLMAERHPRDLVRVHDSVLALCDDPEFAKVARYRKPIGRDAAGNMEYVEGLSIRFAEMLVGALGNVMVGEMIVLDDATKRIIRVGLTDCERNLFHSSDVIVNKTVERKKPREGQRVLGSRLNSAGKMVHEVEATEDETNIKSRAQIAKAIRNLSLRLIPPDFKKEAEARIVATLKAEAKKQPEEARNKLVAAYAAQGISELDLVTYLGHPIDAVTVDEIVDLRAMFLAIKDGEVSWRDIVELKRGGTIPEGAAPEAQPTTKSAEVKSILQRRKAELS